MKKQKPKYRYLVYFFLFFFLLGLYTSLEGIMHLEELNQQISSPKLELLETSQELLEADKRAKELQILTKEKYKFNFEDRPLSSDNAVSSGYFFPVLLFSPNAQYISFKESIVMALALNRTLVLPPFFWSEIDSQKDREVGIKTKSLWFFEETFNKSKLQQLIRTAEFETFLEDCNFKMDTALMFKTHPFVNKSLELYLDLFHGRLTFEKFVNLRAVFQSNDHIKSILGEFRDRCLCVIAPYLTLKPSAMHESMIMVSSYLTRSDHVKLSLKHFFELNRLDGCLIAWHLGIDNNLCPFSDGDGKKLCWGIRERNWASLEDIVSIFKLINSGCTTFLFLDGDRVDAIQNLMSRLSIVTLTDFPSSFATSHPQRYQLSLFEQEIAAQATYFIGTESSAWTEMVLFERLAAGKQSFSLKRLWRTFKIEKDVSIDLLLKESVL